MDKSILAPYSKKHFIQNEINNSKNLYMGFELELVENSDGVETCELQRLINNCNDFNLLVKYDCSVDAEIVSRPELKETLKETLKQTIYLINDSSDNWISWDNATPDHEGGRCGFHLHVNKKGIKSIKNIYKFFNLYHDFFKFLSGRKNFYYCKLDKECLRANYNKRNYSRYCALNNLNLHTLEFRLWRGSLNYDRLAFYVDLTHTICKYSHQLDKLNLSDILILTNNDFIYSLLNTSSAPYPASEYLKEIKTFNRFKKFKHYKSISRTLGLYHKQQHKHNQRLLEKLEKDRIKYMQALENSNNEQSLIINF